MAEDLMEITARARRHALDRLLSSRCDRDLAWKQIQLVSLEFGACKIQEVIRGDGQTFAEFSIVGGGRTLTLKLRFNRRKKLTAMSFLREQSAIYLSS